MDKSLILRKLADLDTYVGQVREYASVSLKDYQGDWKTQRIVERTLQMAIEVCVDIASHIISDSKFRVPTTYADGFRVLKENGLINDELCQILTDMCKFRNVLVHEYREVDPTIVLSILKKHLQDFEQYKSAVLGFIQQS